MRGLESVPNAVRTTIAVILFAGLLAVSGPAATAPSSSTLQCVQYARLVTDISLKGDAWTWWPKAARSNLGRGNQPEPGAVLVFRKSDRLRKGHVAVVAEILGPREILVNHANWTSRRGGDRGRIDTDVMVVDVSPKNDWTKVRVWHAPSETLGNRIYPTHGFIYPEQS